MPERPARANFRKQLCETAGQDERIVGLLITGSGSDGRLDEWSDIDTMFFLRNANFEPFVEQAKTWMEQFGELVLVYEPIGFPHTFWTIYHAEPFPLRVEYVFRPEAQLDTILSVRISPLSVESTVCCDKTGGRLSGYVGQLVGRALSLPASEEQQTFKNRSDQFWYNLLYSYNKLQRGHQWYAHLAFHIGGLDSLMALLKLEANAVARWQASFASWNLENSISPARLTALNACIPGEGKENLQRAMLRAAQLGQEVCQILAERYQCEWPEKAAAEIIGMLARD